MNKNDCPQRNDVSLGERIRMTCAKINLLRRFREWRAFVNDWRTSVNSSLEKLNQEVLELQISNNKLNEELEALRQAFFEGVKNDPFWQQAFSTEGRVFGVRRKETLRFVAIGEGGKIPEGFSGISGEAICNDLNAGKVQRVVLQRLDAQGRLGPPEDQSQLLEFISRYPKGARLIFDAMKLKKSTLHMDDMQLDTTEAEQRLYNDTMDALKREPDLIDFMANGQAAYLPKLAGTEKGVPLPFDAADLLPKLVPAQPKSRSAVFLHNNYYHFNTLAAALKKRGWDAITVSVEPPDSAQQQFYFGEDINLYHDDPKIRHRQICEFLQTVPERFGALHFYGQYQPSFFLENNDNAKNRTRFPWDFMELRRHRTIIGYSASGCADGATQSNVRKISDNVCGRCVWELRPDVCSDAKNQAWAHTLDDICDWVGIEGDWAVGDRVGPKFVRGPIVSALDPDYWTPDLEVPEEMRIERKPGETLIYHAVGNLETRRVGGRDIKGSTAVEAAIAKLQDEGLGVKLFFASKLPIQKVRYYKAQADIVVDQLNYGRIGANGRESFMQGKPVITRLMPGQGEGMPELRTIAEAPALNATEQTIEGVLRDLVNDPEKRQEMSVQSRTFALKWFAADVCARRFEMVIDRVAKGLPPETDELYS